MASTREINEGKLKDLATSFARDFLSISPKKRRDVVGLYGCDVEILENFRGKMESYFREHGEEIPIVLGREGYQINLGHYLS